MMWTDTDTEGRFKWLLVLTLLTLPAPFVWLEIGPGGFEWYGPDVPDIYILGGFITGKDLGWQPILHAFIAQFVGIMLTFLAALLARRFTHYPFLAVLFLLFNAGSLLVFPYWLYGYTVGVIHNSDGVDLTIHPHIGLILYLAICWLTFRLLTILIGRCVKWCLGKVGASSQVKKGGSA